MSAMPRRWGFLQQSQSDTRTTRDHLQRTSWPTCLGGSVGCRLLGVCRRLSSGGPGCPHAASHVSCFNVTHSGRGMHQLEQGKGVVWGWCITCTSVEHTGHAEHIRLNHASPKVISTSHEAAVVCCLPEDLEAQQTRPKDGQTAVTPVNQAATNSLTRLIADNRSSLLKGHQTTSQKCEHCSAFFLAFHVQVPVPGDASDARSTPAQTVVTASGT